MSKKTQEYRSETIVVKFEPRRCIHSAECVHGHPEVFDADRKPWIEPERGEADEIARVVERCPTGALSYERRDGADGEPVPDSNEARLGADGPLYLRGRLRIELPDGEVVEETRAALCRCGASSHRPFCDGSHSKAGFEDEGSLGEARLASSESEEEDPAAPLEIVCVPDGPLTVEGPLTIRPAEGDDTHRGRKGALCRCGASANRPYCDGSHVGAGFTG